MRDDKSLKQTNGMTAFSPAGKGCFMNEPVKYSKPKTLVIGLFIFVFYVIAAKLGLELAFVNASATAVWAPTGIALASFLIFGKQFWPSIFAGAFLVNLLTAGSFTTSLVIAGGNTLEGLLGALLVHQFANGRKVFERASDILKFIVAVELISTAVSPTVGVTILCLEHYASWNAYRRRLDYLVAGRLDRRASRYAFFDSMV